MLEKEKAIDAVLCATPDHLHAFVSITAMKAGKHVYCEKPLTHNIWEARQVARVAKETGVATQMGNQGHSGEGIRQTCEWIWDGAIGPVREVHAWSDTGGWAKTAGRPRETPPVPAGLELGPVARAARDRALSSGLRPVQLARLVGLRHRRDRRHGLPQHGPGRVGAGAGAPDERGGHVGGDRRRSGLAPRRGPSLSFRAARRHAAGDADLVRRRTPPARAEGDRPQGPASSDWARAATASCSSATRA